MSEGLQPAFDESIQFSQSDVEQALGAAKVAWPRMGDRAELAYRALVAERDRFEKALREIAEDSRQLREGWDAAEYWKHAASQRREIAIRVLS